MPFMNLDDEPEEKVEDKKEGKKEVKLTSKPTIEKASGTPEGSKKIKTIAEAFNPAIIAKFLAWVAKQDKNQYPRQKGAIDQLKRYHKDATFAGLLDLFQIYLQGEIYLQE